MGRFLPMVSRASLTWCAVLVWLVPASLSAQDITRGPAGTVSVRATEVPLERLLQALAEITPFEKIVLKDGVGARPVTVTLENVTVLRAVVQALNVAGVDYVLGGGRLVVGDSTFSGALGSTAVQELRAADTPNNATDDRARKRAEADAAQARTSEESRAADDGGAAADAQLRHAELEHALAPPALPVPPGAPIDLPFPGPDGTTPISVIKPANGPAQALPFPGSAGTSSPAIAPRSSDPRVQQLIDALTVKRPPGD